MKTNLQKPKNNERSDKWPALRDKFLEGKVCIVCGGKKKLNAHHIKPFHLFPQLELVITNLAPICEGNPIVNCHCLFGHLGNFESYNPNVIQDAAIWNAKIKNRPTGKI
jgi:5-methylcytosine-specific restriction enzyme A